jgi:hypothetical protein
MEDMVNLRRHLMLITAIPIVHCPLWLHSHCGSALYCPLLNYTPLAQTPEDIPLWMTQLQMLVRVGHPERVPSHLLELAPEFLGAKPVTRIARIGDREPQDVCA